MVILDILNAAVLLKSKWQRKDGSWWMTNPKPGGDFVLYDPEDPDDMEDAGDMEMTEFMKDVITGVNFLKAKWQRKDGSWWQTNPDGGKPIPAKAPGATELKRDFKSSFNPIEKFAKYARKNGTYDIKGMFKEFGETDKEGREFLILGGEEKVKVFKGDLHSLKKANVNYKPLLVAQVTQRVTNKKTGKVEEKVKKQSINPLGQTHAAVEGNFQRIRSSLPALAKMGDILKASFDSPNEKEAQCSVISAIMHETAARVGSRLDKKHFGISSLQARHAEINEEGHVRLKFDGKSGEKLDFTLSEELSNQVKKYMSNKEPEDRLFSVNELHVRPFLRDISGHDIHPHDLRRHRASLVSLSLLMEMPPPGEGESEDAINKRLDDAFKKTAEVLGHKDALTKKPKLARSVYTDPVLELAWRDGTLHERAQKLGYLKSLGNGLDRLLASLYDDWDLRSLDTVEPEEE